MLEFCRRENIPIDVCGKVIVAIDEQERPRLDAIYQRGQANGIRCEKIGRERLTELEPHTAGIEAIHVPEAGILDYRQVSERLGAILTERGGQILLNARVTGFDVTSKGVVVHSTAGDVAARWVVTCAGLQADRVTKLTGQEPEAPILPFRGEYYDLRPEAQHLCRNLIYPVPDPSFPFLGVHFTRMIHGGVECGPNAVLAFAREGYTNTTVNLRDLAGACLPWVSTTRAPPLADGAGRASPFLQQAGLRQGPPAADSRSDSGRSVSCTGGSPRHGTGKGRCVAR